MNLSTALKLADIDNFITPAQECVKPVHINKENGKTTKIRIEQDGEYTGITEEGKEYKLEKAQISLNDCLACSGCVTTAESVLISEQSHEEFLRFLLENTSKCASDKKFVVVSISPQSRANLAAQFSMSVESVTKHINGYLKSLGVDLLIDTTFSREFSLLLSAKEFCEKYQDSNTSNQLPMLASACPGWICYAEKTQGPAVLPYISQTRSPQQIMGRLVKSYLIDYIKSRYKDTNEQLYQKVISLCKGGVYHACIMPCFDKKLESSREEFSFLDDHTGKRERDVDLVLSTAEMLIMLGGQSISDYPQLETDSVFNCFIQTDSTSSLYSHNGSGSGGYLDFILRYAAKELFNFDIMDSKSFPLEYKILRNQDIQEVVLKNPKCQEPDRELLRFAFAYGFRNIQTIVQQIKRKRCKYHFVEIMACPGGCLNGGGQIRDQSNNELVSHSKLLNDTKQSYFSLECQIPLLNRQVAEIYEELVARDPELKEFRTFYKEVPKIEIINPAALKW